MIKTAKAAKPAAKKASVRKSAPVKKAEADLEAKVAQKATAGPKSLNVVTLAEQRRKWAVELIMQPYASGGALPLNVKEVTANADALVEFVTNGTVPKA